MSLSLIPSALELEEGVATTTTIVTNNNNGSSLLPQTFSTTNSDSISCPPYIIPEYFKILLHILYNVVLVAGVIGNGLVLYVIYSVRRMRTVTNYLLANLALGDLIIALCIPFTYISIIYEYWPFGNFLCYFVSPFNAIAVLVSAFTLIALALEKYVAILHPLSPRLRKSRVVWVIGVIWLGAVITASPIAVVSQVSNVVSGNGSLPLPICHEAGWKSEEQELTYNLCLMLIQYFIPLCVLTFTYIRIANVVWGLKNESVQGPNGGVNLNRSSRITDKRSRKAVLLTLAVVLGFMLAWFPYNLSYILRRHSQIECLNVELQILCHWFAMSHCFYNPIIYAWINSSFKNAFKSVCCKIFCCEDKRDSRLRSSKYLSSITTNSSVLKWKSYRKISFAPDPLRKISVVSPQNIIVKSTNSHATVAK